MNKVARVAKVDYIRKMCVSSESIPIETALLIAESKAPRYAHSAAALKKHDSAVRTRKRPRS
jgi:hypothetical protein